MTEAEEREVLGKILRQYAEGAITEDEAINAFIWRLCSLERAADAKDTQ